MSNPNHEALQDIIVKDTETHGSMFVPIILRSNKMTISVAIGQTKFYPLYRSRGNVHNNIHHVHCNAILLIGFLSIPKKAIFKLLRSGMIKPEVTHCPNGHFWHVIYGLDPYIADYPKQVLLACTVQN
ncbi:hypothetical protein HETIRDRAFT_419687 [Heterobasidion irregulare TC 32-1]|uniref:Uncharacterized protein n=1 Tax=Heterobasidion irregulare (strain TC 32-1) TaxID=747525 RepID=W4K2Q3_HETIT|nr:uncharacterized protein HETIRDRAFT_419687 [Heterobasidion irregulare TC 32-1]ETW80097.1 hypothetical protein HETIRDRAFT_419687 [Heterobasidion irregulare TC 32-1]